MVRCAVSKIFLDNSLDTFLLYACSKLAYDGYLVS